MSSLPPPPPAAPVPRPRLDLAALAQLRQATYYPGTRRGVNVLALLAVASSVVGYVISLLLNQPPYSASSEMMSIVTAARITGFVGTVVYITAALVLRSLVQALLDIADAAVERRRAGTGL